MGFPHPDMVGMTECLLFNVKKGHESKTNPHPVYLPTLLAQAFFSSPALTSEVNQTKRKSTKSYSGHECKTGEYMCVCSFWYFWCVGWGVGCVWVCVHTHACTHAHAPPPEQKYIDIDIFLLLHLHFTKRPLALFY